MGTFAFVLHPLRIEDFARKYPLARALPPRWVESAFALVRPRVLSHVTGIASPAGATAEGWLIGLGLTPRTLLEADLQFVYRRLIESGRLAERLGAKIVGLGAFTKIVGDRGRTVADALDIAVTTGNSYTAATGVEGALEAARAMGIAPREARAAVVGATGSIGAVCSRLLARSVRSLALVARDHARLTALAGTVAEEAGIPVSAGDDVRGAVRDADVVITVTSATEALIAPEDLKPGAVVCDVARPRNVSRLVYERRDDVLVIDGGVIEIPGDVDFGFDFGFPPRTAEACMAEAILLALEERYEDFTIGRDISLDRVEEIARLARTHGFRLAGFRRFERRIGDEEVAAIRERAHAVVR